MRVAGADADAVQEGGGGSVANTRSGTAKNWLSNNGSHEGTQRSTQGRETREREPVKCRAAAGCSSVINAALLQY